MIEHRGRCIDMAKVLHCASPRHQKNLHLSVKGPHRYLRTSSLFFERVCRSLPAQSATGCRFSRIFLLDPGEWSNYRGNLEDTLRQLCFFHSCLSSTSVGNMHSTRSSCAVMHWGVPTVVIKEKYEKRWFPFRKTMGSTGLFGVSDRLALQHRDTPATAAAISGVPHPA